MNLTHRTKLNNNSKGSSTMLVCGSVFYVNRKMTTETNSKHLEDKFYPAIKRRRTTKITLFVVDYESLLRFIDIKNQVLIKVVVSHTFLFYRK